MGTNGFRRKARLACKHILLRIGDPPPSVARAAAQPMSTRTQYGPLISRGAGLCLQGTSPDIGSVSDRSRLFIQAGRIDISMSPYLKALCLEYLAICIPKASIGIIGSVLCLAQPLVWAATAVTFPAGLRSGLVLIPSRLLVRPIASGQSHIAGKQQQSRYTPQMVRAGSNMHHGENLLHARNDRPG